MKAVELDERLVDLAIADQQTRRHINMATKEYNMQQVGTKGMHVRMFICILLVIFVCTYIRTYVMQYVYVCVHNIIRMYVHVHRGTTHVYTGR